ncbi:HesA/MoeB/ThiF family protein [Neoehrlichia mikurensis]|nr:HesA/MoeB/ThiF family protein [Neoehrlichia mikurensis]QXK93234.1 HesA/MoeB/ThiF family protein [Neoehrlichia mikurensis]QXK94079.1 HesA/MoeB/ThiF family protein [Neoehrlichia mikurensis]
MIIPQIGIEGQKSLKNSQVLVIGCGGIGSIVIPLIAASGIGKIILCDNDNIQLPNFNRQIIYRENNIGSSKVLKSKEFVELFNSDIEVEALNVFVGPKNFESIFSSVDLVIDCTDRLAIKLFLNDACVLIGKALIHSAAIGFTGQVLTIPPYGKPCLRCFFEDRHMSVNLNCANAGILSATVGVVGSIISMEVVKHLINISTNLVGKLLRIDLENNRFVTYDFIANKSCIACGDNVKVDPYDANNYESKLYF